MPTSHRLLVLCVIVLLTCAQGAFADSQTRSGTIFGNSGGGDAWSNTGNAATSDDARASATETMGGIVGTAHLTVSGLGFSIPAGATIDGIEVMIEGHSVGSATLPVIGAEISKDVAFSSFISIALTGNAAAPGPPDTFQTQGTPTDLWSQSWTPAEINASTFGARVQALDGDLFSAASSTYFVDHVELTVHYTPAVAMPAAGRMSRVLSTLILCGLGVLCLRRIRRTLPSTVELR